MHASEKMNCMLPDGEVPGLKSDAIATGSPFCIISRAGESGRFRKNAHPGNKKLKKQLKDINNHVDLLDRRIDIHINEEFADPSDEDIADSIDSDDLLQ